MFWGWFESSEAALEALDDAIASASELLGYPIRARGRAASPVGGTERTAAGPAADSACPPSSSFIPIWSIGFLRTIGRRG
jgi:hypothetical protein